MGRCCDAESLPQRRCPRRNTAVCVVEVRHMGAECKAICEVPAMPSYKVLQQTLPKGSLGVSSALVSGCNAIKKIHLPSLEFDSSCMHLQNPFPHGYSGINTSSAFFIGSWSDKFFITTSLLSLLPHIFAYIREFMKYQICFFPSLVISRHISFSDLSSLRITRLYSIAVN